MTELVRAAPQLREPARGPERTEQTERKERKERNGTERDGSDRSPYARSRIAVTP